MGGAGDDVVCRLSGGQHGRNCGRLCRLETTEETLNTAWAILEILTAYILADLASGLYHLATDRGMNIKSQIAMFQEHHITNTMIGFDWQTFAAGMPVAIAGGWFHSPFLIALGIFLALTQVTHYYAHVRSKNRAIRHIVGALQELGVIVHPANHQRHHGGAFDRDFCLLSGWNNWWLNRVLAYSERRAVA